MLTVFIDTIRSSYARPAVVRLGGALLALGCCGPTGCGPAGCGATKQPRAAHPNVVLISLDSLRPDHLGCYGYRSRTGAATSPRIDALARDGVVFENVVSTTTWTMASHHALMSGLPDLVHGAINDPLGASLQRVSLPQVLSAAGYATAGFYSGPYLGPKYGFDRGFDDGHYQNVSGVEEQLVTAAAAERNREEGSPADRDAPGALQRAAAKVSLELEQSYHRTSSAKRVSDRAIEWLAEWRADQQPSVPAPPFFLFLHYFDIHYDFAPPEESWARAFWPDGRRPRLNGDAFFDSPQIQPTMNREELAGVVSYYDGEIRWTDSQVGRVLDQLAALGVADDTLVVIVSDHGDEFFEHGHKGHRQTLFQETLATALVARWPNGLPAGKRITPRVSIVDVAPTIVELCGATAKADFQADPIAGLEPGDLVHGMWGASLTPLIDGRESGDRDCVAFLANTWQDAAHPLYSWALLSGRYKLIVSRRCERVGDPAANTQLLLETIGKVFDLAQDPREQTDLSRSSEADVKAAIARFDATFASGGRLGRLVAAIECGPPPPPLSPIESTWLRQLGYTPPDDDGPKLPAHTKVKAVAPPLPSFPRRP